MPNPLMRQAAIWAAIFIGMVLVSQLFGLGGSGTAAKAPEVSYSTLLGRIQAAQVTKASLDGEQLVATLRDGSKIRALIPNDPELLSDLRKQGVDIKVVQPEGGNTFLAFLLSFGPTILFLGVMLWMMRQQLQGLKGGGSGGGPFGFGKARVQVQSETKVKTLFEDVAGVDEAKAELTEVVDFLKDPTKYQKLGGRIPKGVLLIGSPGTGKTMLAKAVAGEAGVPFFSISGSDFVEMFVGVGAARVRDLFETGKKNAPCIIFIDEIDAVGRHRGAGMGGGNDEREQTLNAMLVEMDGFDATEGVIIIAATNRADVLDPALLRPGRFDRQVVVPLPDLKGREQILTVHIQKVPVADDVDAAVLARGTPGFSGADLANLVNEAALLAARYNKRLVDMHDFEQAKDKVMMGAERKSAVLTPDTKHTIAVHEAGHAIASLFLSGPTDPLHKVTIIPRGRALGVTMSLPSEDRFLYHKDFCENQIAMLFGGRLAEELCLNGQQTSGASNDIERATELARRMVTQWGMSPLGPINYGDKETSVFMGRDLGSRTMVSESTAAQVDAEVRKLIDTNFKRCKDVLVKHRKQLDALTAALLEHETLDRSQIDALMAGQPIIPTKPQVRSTPAQAGASSTPPQAPTKVRSTPAKAGAQKPKSPKA